MNILCSRCNKKPAFLEAQSEDSQPDNPIYYTVCEDCLKEMMGEQGLRGEKGREEAMTTRCSKCRKPATLKVQGASVDDEPRHLWTPRCESCLKKMMPQYPLRVRQVGVKP